jgi:phenylacetic acid degradation operon negative regulatory protein
VQLHDPMLPLALLPPPWIGSEAYALARQIYRRVAGLAETYLMEVLRREDAAAPQADAGFYGRFEGLNQPAW